MDAYNLDEPLLSLRIEDDEDDIYLRDSGEEEVDESSTNKEEGDLEDEDEEDW